VSVAQQTFVYGEHTVTIETGRMARQADGAVLVTMADTVVLVTAVARKQAVPGKEFFPSITRKRHSPPAASPAVFSSVKGARPRRKC